MATNTKTPPAVELKASGRTMNAIVIRAPGGPEVMEFQTVEEAKAMRGEVLIKVVAAGLNKADCMQRKGNQPPPEGESLYPGLECSGVVEAIGPGVKKWKVGDEIQGGGGGIGTFAIQLAKAKGCRVFCTTYGAASLEKVTKCVKLGALVGIDYNEEDFVARVLQVTQGKGVDVILDIIGAPYLTRNLEALGMDGRLYILGMQSGPRGDVDITAILKKRITIASATLRHRSKESKAEIVEEVLQNVWPEIESGKVKPVVENTFALKNAVQGHRLMESNTHFGKILLLPNQDA